MSAVAGHAPTPASPAPQASPHPQAPLQASPHPRSPRRPDPTPGPPAGLTPPQVPLQGSPHSQAPLQVSPHLQVFLVQLLTLAPQLQDLPLCCLHLHRRRGHHQVASRCPLRVQVPLGYEPIKLPFVGRCVPGAPRLCVGCGLGTPLATGQAGEQLGRGRGGGRNITLEAAQSSAGAVGSEAGSVCQLGGGWLSEWTPGVPPSQAPPSPLRPGPSGCTAARPPGGRRA